MSGGRSTAPGLLGFITNILVISSDPQFLPSPMFRKLMLRVDAAFHPHFSPKRHFK